MYIHYICQWDWGKRQKRIGRQGPTAERMRTLAGRERMPSVSIWRRRDCSAGGKLSEREWVIILKRESISCRKSIVAIYPSARAFISKARSTTVWTSCRRNRGESVTVGLLFDGYTSVFSNIVSRYSVKCLPKMSTVTRKRPPGVHVRFPRPVLGDLYLLFWFGSVDIYLINHVCSVNLV